ncbi:MULTISPECIES: hypothetical protein [Polaribacter]|uniref:Uncharacterized protein n=1 Tax=Polaribacter butkevichii TaxID=218490 RepID=A0A2P6CBZ6_9FLAO|nr:hypothetical protein [Polaribacter butkevichii]PQJ72436.1 hypothetical protein BTO14_03855 [Polaribacter butkevichii]
MRRKIQFYLFLALAALLVSVTNLHAHTTNKNQKNTHFKQQLNVATTNYLATSKIVKHLFFKPSTGVNTDLHFSTEVNIEEFEESEEHVTLYKQKPCFDHSIHTVSHQYFIKNNSIKTQERTVYQNFNTRTTHVGLYVKFEVFRI